jgi:hypothetical protein
VIVQRDHLTVVLLLVHPLQDHQAVVHHQSDQALVVHLPLPVHNLVRIVQPAEVVPIEQAQHVRFLKVVKSAIHAGFDLHHKNATSRESDRASLNQIFLKTLLVKSLRRAFEQNS